MRPTLSGALRALRSAACGLAPLALAACGDPGPVEWREPQALTDVARGDARLAALRLDSGGAPTGGTPAPAFTPPGAACEGSLRIAPGGAGEWHAVWFRPGAHGTAAILAARSRDDGATWSAPAVVDGRDAGQDGCGRPAPAVAADSLTGYVHIVYFLRPREGAGVWYTHSMDRGATFHSTAALIYGEEPARASVASDGMILAAAYEIPHTRPRRIGLSLSRDGGHTFERPSPVSRGSAGAESPRVAARGRGVALAWTETDGSGEGIPTRTVLRLGEVRP
jgi:hypothetical protein